MIAMEAGRPDERTTSPNRTTTEQETPYEWAVRTKTIFFCEKSMHLRDASRILPALVPENGAGSSANSAQFDSRKTSSTRSAP
jgi:hypothetical protein